jgi:hypothetical protein
MRCEMPGDTEHRLIQEREINYRAMNAREYAWLNYCRKSLHSVLEANVRARVREAV